MPLDRYDTLASEEAARLGVHRTTLVSAIQGGACAGEERGGRWYTSQADAAAWYKVHYKHRNPDFSLRAGKPWSDIEVALLRDMLAKGEGGKAIARKLGRAEGAVYVKISKLRGADDGIEQAQPAPASGQQAEVPPSLLPHAPYAPPPGLDEYQLRRRMERDGKVRLSLHPDVKSILGDAARRHGMTLAVFVTRAGLAAAARPEILAEGLRISEKLRKE